MDAIDVAMKNIFYRINPEILNVAFNPVARQMSIDACIRQDVINNKVLTDINLVGGKIHDIVLRPEWSIYTPPPSPYIMQDLGCYSIFQIPEDAREYRDIVSVISLLFPHNWGYGNSMSSSMFPHNTGATMSSLAGVSLNSQTLAANLTTPTPILLQGNIVKIEPGNSNYTEWVLQCRLAWDANFTNMDNTPIKAFSDLVYIAVRGYIYTQLSITGDRIFLSGGQELNSIKEYILEGKDYLDRYDEALTEFTGSMLLSRKDMATIIGMSL